MCVCVWGGGLATLCDLICCLHLIQMVPNPISQVSLFFVFFLPIYQKHKPLAKGSESVGRDTLTKACKFARQYGEEQVKHILKGKFVLSWFELAQSLTMAPQK